MALWSMSPGWDCFFSKQKRFLAFQIDQATIAHTSISLPVSLSSICLAREWKSCTTAELFCNFPLTSAQTLVANGHSHNAWQTDSSAWPQIAKLGSIGESSSRNISSSRKDVWASSPKEVLHLRWYVQSPYFIPQPLILVRSWKTLWNLRVFNYRNVKMKQQENRTKKQRENWSLRILWLNIFSTIQYREV